MALSSKISKKTVTSGFEDLGQIVQFHRKKSGLTQAQLAKLAGIGKTAVFDLEHKNKQPRLNTISRILEILNIKVAFDSPLMAAYERERHAQS